MPKKEKKNAEVQVEGVQKEILDGGTVSTVISMETRNLLYGVSRRLNRVPGWVIREALKSYLNSFGGAA